MITQMPHDEPTPILKFCNVSASYGSIKALTDINLAIYPKEIVTLIGANGAGKSTLLMSIFSQPKINHGEILYNNSPISELETHNIAKLKIAIAPEGRRIFPKMSILENLNLGTIANFDSQLNYKQNITHVFDLFPILADRSKQRAGTLSGGEQQMLAIGRAMMGDPDLLLLDEPSLGLAPKIIDLIFKVLEKIAKNNTTIFLVEQNANIALKFANRGYVLANGKIIMQGESDNLLKDPKIKAAYLGG